VLGNSSLCYGIAPDFLPQSDQKRKFISHNSESIRSLFLRALALVDIFPKLYEFWGVLINNGSVTFNLEVIALKIWLVSLLAIS